MVKVSSQTRGVRVEKVPGRERYSAAPMAGNQVLPGGGAKSKLSMRPTAGVVAVGGARHPRGAPWPTSIVLTPSDPDLG